MLTVNFNLLPVDNGNRVLDVGCGEGRHSYEVCRLNHCALCSLDMDFQCVRKTRYVLLHMDSQRVSKGYWNVMRADALSLPFKDASFDRIICSEVLEHVADDEQGIRELVRVLKPGGAMAITVPTYLTETVYWALDQDYYNHPGGHVRKYKTRELSHSLARNHLAIYAIHHEHAFHSIYWLLRCIFRLKNEQARIPALYFKLLEWHILTRSRFISLMERIFNFVFPKSVVIYARKL